MSDLVEVRPRRSWGLLLPSLGYGRCWRCRRPWFAARLHDVEYKPGSGQFALCEPCWNRSTPEARIAAHFWVTVTVSRSIDEWPMILAAIKGDGS